MKRIPAQLLALSLLLISCVGNGDPTSEWLLDDGTQIRFFHQSHTPPGKDTIKHFVVTKDGDSTDFKFAQWHAGYNNVELHISPDSTIVWIVYFENRSRKVIGCCYDLASKKFVDERGEHPRQVGLTTGLIVPKRITGDDL